MLKKLLSKIRPETVHKEIDWGLDVGKEILPIIKFIPPPPPDLLSDEYYDGYQDGYNDGFTEGQRNLKKR